MKKKYLIRLLDTCHPGSSEIYTKMKGRQLYWNRAKGLVERVLPLSDEQRDSLRASGAIEVTEVKPKASKPKKKPKASDDGSTTQ